MPNLADFEALIARLAMIDFSQTSEQATREMAVNPVIGALGWDTFNPGEVAREHPVRGGSSRARNAIAGCGRHCRMPGSRCSAIPRACYPSSSPKR